MNPRARRLRRLRRNRAERYRRVMAIVRRALRDNLGPLGEPVYTLSPGTFETTITLSPSFVSYLNDIGCLEQTNA